MAARVEVDIDDDFSEIYKAYTGPLGSNPNATNAQDRITTKKRSNSGSDEEEEARDPNAVPTDFTSREAKVWEAKSKATERNWKKRKEEEMICKLCGESGHFTQGCPSTLGANRKSQDYFERVPARDPHVKALFNEKVVDEIEKDIGCKIKIEEKFIIVSGKDRLVLKKGVDAVHKVKKEGEHKHSSSSPISRSWSPERKSPVSSRLVRSNSQRSNPSPHNALQVPHRYGRQEKVVVDRVCEDLRKLSRGSLQERAASVVRDLEWNCLTRSSSGEAYGNDGVRGRSSHSRSPELPSYVGDPYNLYDGRSQSRGGYRFDGLDADRRGSDMQSCHKFEYPAFPQTFEEIESDYKREAMDLVRIRDKEEDEEIHKHREAVREIRECYMKKLAMLRAAQAKQWEEFLQANIQRRQHAHQHISASGFSDYKQPSYPEYDNSSGNANYSGPGTNVPIESTGKYRNSMENYPSRPHVTYSDFEHKRGDEFGKSYNRY